MAKAFTKESFTIDHESWFKDNWGFMPTEDELRHWCQFEPGLPDLLLGIFSESCLQKRFKKEMEK